MTTDDFIIELFCRVDDRMDAIDKHPQASQYPSELVTIGLLFALKGGYFRARVDDAQERQLGDRTDPSAGTQARENTRHELDKPSLTHFRQG